MFKEEITITLYRLLLLEQRCADTADRFNVATTNFAEKCEDFYRNIFPISTFPLLHSHVDKEKAPSFLRVCYYTDRGSKTLNSFALLFFFMYFFSF